MDKLIFKSYLEIYFPYKDKFVFRFCFKYNFPLTTLIKNFIIKNNFLIWANLCLILLYFQV